MVFYLSLFILELVLLFFLSKKLVNSLAQLFYQLNFSHKTVVHILAILFLPGTIIHELAHLLVAGVIFIPVGELNVLPQIEGEQVKLGSVQIGKSDPFRRMIVGVAPVFVGILSILGILYFLQIGNNFVWWYVLLSLYLVFEIGNTMFSSDKDLEGVIGFFIAILLVGLAALGSLYFLRPVLLQNIWLNLHKIDISIFANFFKQTSFYLTIPISLDLIIIFMTKLFKKLYN